MFGELTTVRYKLSSLCTQTTAFFFSGTKIPWWEWESCWGDAKQNTKQTQKTWDRQVSCWVNFRQEAPELTSVAPPQALEEPCQPPAITWGSSYKSNLSPLNSFTGNCNVGQRGEQCGVMCKLIHSPERYEAGCSMWETWSQCVMPKGNHGMNWFHSLTAWCKCL